ncbi:MAG: hypothetical protein E7190_00360 [Erysipelotrichaceae bacterium]|nr:hypothetical protein [Erysipelotrichaceae bacterium]
MTVKELYELAKNMMFEKKSSKDYDGYYMLWINVLLSENFDLNNHLRLKHGREKLTEVPTVSLDTDVLPYENEMCWEILPYGLAAKFFIDDDLSKYDIFNTDYENRQSKYMWGVEVEVEDVYRSIN